MIKLNTLSCPRMLATLRSSLLPRSISRAKYSLIHHPKQQSLQELALLLVTSEASSLRPVASPLATQEASSLKPAVSLLQVAGSRHRLPVPQAIFLHLSVSRRLIRKRRTGKSAKTKTMIQKKRLKKHGWRGTKPSKKQRKQSTWTPPKAPLASCSHPPRSLQKRHSRMARSTRKTMRI